MKREKLKCPREVCGYEWTPRVDNPVECPYCKHYLKDSGDKPDKEQDARADEA